MNDEFEKWLDLAFSEVGGGVRYQAVCFDLASGFFGGRANMTPEQVRRLIRHLARLSGPAPGPLPAGELEAIRERLSEDGPVLCRDLADARALLRHADALAADLAAAEGAMHDLTSPDQTDGSLAYARGVEDERRRCVALLVAEADRRNAIGIGEEGTYAARHYDRAAMLIASPPAPAAAPGGE